MKPAEMVRELRAERSQEELAYAAGVSTSTVARIESGEVDPRVGTLRKLAKASVSTLVLSYNRKRARR